MARDKKEKKKKVVVEEPVELYKYYFLADVYAVVAVEAEDPAEAKQLVKAIEAKDFINFSVKKAKLINPKIYMPKEEDEDEEEEDTKKKSKKKLRGKDAEDEDEADDLLAEPSMA